MELPSTFSEPVDAISLLPCLTISPESPGDGSLVSAFSVNPNAPEITDSDCCSDCNCCKNAANQTHGEGSRSQNGHLCVVRNDKSFKLNSRYGPHKAKRRITYIMSLVLETIIITRCRNLPRVAESVKNELRFTFEEKSPLSEFQLIVYLAPSE